MRILTGYMHPLQCAAKARNPNTNADMLFQIEHNKSGLVFLLKGKRIYIFAEQIFNMNSKVAENFRTEWMDVSNILVLQMRRIASTYVTAVHIFMF